MNRPLTLLGAAIIFAGLGCSGDSESGGSAGAAPGSGGAPGTGGTAGGQTGGTTGTAGTNPGATPLTSLDDACESELQAGRTVLDRVTSPYTATLEYLPAEALSPTPMTLTVTYNDGEILCFPSFSCADCGAPDRPAYVTLDVDVTFVTEDGSFDEAMPGTLQGEMLGTSLSASIMEADLQGTYQTGYSTNEYVDQSVSVNGTFATSAISGSVMKSAKRGVEPKPGEVVPSVVSGVGNW